MPRFVVGVGCGRRVLLWLSFSLRVPAFRSAAWFGGCMERKPLLLCMRPQSSTQHVHKTVRPRGCMFPGARQGVGLLPLLSGLGLGPHSSVALSSPPKGRPISSVAGSDACNQKDARTQHTRPSLNGKRNAYWCTHMPRMARANLPAPLQPFTFPFLPPPPSFLMTERPPTPLFFVHALPDMFCKNRGLSTSPAYDLPTHVSMPLSLSPSLDRSVPLTGAAEIGEGGS